jgi:DNA polymerase III alpha subunit
MKYDQYGQAMVSADDLFELLYRDPKIDLAQYPVLDPEQYNNSVQELVADLDPLPQYRSLEIPIAEFDQQNQARWFMPKEYQDFDIAKWLIDQCRTDQELERVADELVRYQAKELFPLLCYLKYLVDVMHQHDIVWGVGRGSSVSSYVLYLIGVHRINSLHYNLDIEEFLRE